MQNIFKASKNFATGVTYTGLPSLEFGTNNSGNIRLKIRYEGKISIHFSLMQKMRATFQIAIKGDPITFYDLVFNQVKTLSNRFYD